ncbi:MAG: hypothetical protein AAGJ94_13325 [Pseudomonadota bacterium]
MLSQDWVQPAIGPLSAGIGICLLKAWLAHARNKPRPADKSGHMYYPTEPKIFYGAIGIVCFALALAVEILPEFYGMQPVNGWITVLICFFSAVGLLSTVQLFVANYKMSDRGIQYRNWLWEWKFIPWSEVVSLEACGFESGFLVYSKPYQKIFLSYNLVGIPEFAELALLHVDMKAADPPTQQCLRDAVEGNQPATL